MEKNIDVNHKNNSSNIDKIFDPDLTLDEKLIYYEGLLDIAVDKNDLKLQNEIYNIIDELKSRSGYDENK